MKLPNREKAFIQPAKLNDYLLSETHAIGRSKAKFFRLFGFDETNVDLLEQGLLLIAKTQNVVSVTPSTHGTKYVIDGSLQTPVGGLLNLRTVWIINKGQTHPRFVTAIPN